MPRYTAVLILAGLFGLAAVASAPTSAQAPACLHGPAETPDHRARRLAALKLANQLNEFEAAGRLQAERFYPMEDLPGLPPLPRGFKAQMSTDGASYAFSLKDTLDPCRFAYFSDHDRVVYAATPVP